MTIPTISTLPVAPARTDAPATFVTRADAFLAALVVMQGELNTSIGAMNTDIAGVNADATAAAASASAAASSATAAANAAGAALWVSGQAYAQGDAAISLVNYQTYRAETATSGTTDPSLDANWTAISGTFPVQTGNAGKYLTTDGTDPSWATVSSGVTTMTATGNITAGQSVSLRSDGTVEPTSGIHSKLGLTGNADNGTTSTEAYQAMAYDSDQDRFLKVSQYGGSTYVQAIKLETDGTITSGTALVLIAANMGDIPNIFYDETHNKFLIILASGGVLYETTATIDPSDNSVSFTTLVDIDGSTGGLATAAVCYDSDANQYFFYYRDAGTDNANGVYATFDGSSLTFGTAATIVAGPTVNYYTEAVYCPEATRVVTYNGRIGSNGGFLTAILNSSGTPVAGVTVEVNSTVQNKWASLVWNPQDQAVFLANVANNYLYFSRLTISSSTLTVTSTNEISTNNIYQFLRRSAAYNASTKKIDYFVSFNPEAQIKYYEIDTSTDTATWSNILTVVSSTGTQTYGGFAYSPVAGGYLANWYDNSFTNTNREGFWGIKSSTTNATKFFGIAAEAITSGQSGNITTAGGLNTEVSGLTTGKNYYVSADGSLTDSQTQFGFVGTANSATSILVNPTKAGNTAIVTANGAIKQGDNVRLNQNGEAETISGLHFFAKRIGTSSSLVNGDEDFAVTQYFPEADLYFSCYGYRLRLARLNSDGTYTLGPELSFGGYLDRDNKASVMYHAATNRFVVCGKGSGTQSQYPMIYQLSWNSSTLALSLMAQYTMGSAGTNSWGYSMAMAGDNYIAVNYSPGNGQAYFRYIKPTAGGSWDVGAALAIGNSSVTRGSLSYDSNNDLIYMVHQGASRQFLVINRSGGTASYIQIVNGWTNFNGQILSYVDTENSKVIWVGNNGNGFLYYEITDATATGWGTAPTTQSLPDPRITVSTTFNSYVQAPIFIAKVPNKNEFYFLWNEDTSGYRYAGLLDYDPSSNSLSLNNISGRLVDDSGVAIRFANRDYWGSNGNFSVYNSVVSGVGSITHRAYSELNHVKLYAWVPTYDSATTSNFIGVSLEEIADSQNGQLLVSGSYIDAQYSLSAASNVYFDAYGNITNTVSGTSIGKTILADKILLD